MLRTPSAMQTRRRSWFLASALALGVAAPARLGAQPTSTRLRVGATANDTYAEVYYALDAGLFRKAGLDVEIATLNNSNAIAAAIAGGTLDVGVSTPLQLAIAFLHGVPFKLVAAGALSTTKAPSFVLCVLKNSPIPAAPGTWKARRSR